MSENEIEQVAIGLRRDFPHVPLRILTTVLACYLPVTATVADAIRATSDRIADACAT